LALRRLALSGLRTNTLKGALSSKSSLVRWVPIFPVAPVTKIVDVIILRFGVVLEGRRIPEKLKQRLQGKQMYCKAQKIPSAF
jgi:hypothetical protein